MIDELQLIHDYVAMCAPRTDDLARAHQRLQSVIRAEVAPSREPTWIPTWAQAVFTRVRWQYSFVGLSALAVAVAVAVLTLNLISIPGGSPAAAATLRATARAAAAHSRSFGGPSYLEDRSLYRVDIYTSEVPADRLTLAAEATYTETEQEWINSSSTSHGLLSRGALQFSSTSQEDAWIGTTSGQQFSRTFQRVVVLPSLTNVLDVSRLPTNPRELELLIASGHTGTWVDNIAPGPGVTFERATLLLGGPDVGLTPALASALFTVLGDQPRATQIGPATDHLGRRGTAITVPAANGSVEVIVNSRTGSLLETRLPPAPLHLGATTNGKIQMCSASKGCITLSPARAASVVAPVWIDPVASVAVSGSDVTRSRRSAS